MSMNDIYPANVNLDLPKRPPWSYSMTCAEVDQIEGMYFKVSMKFSLCSCHVEFL